MISALLGDFLPYIIGGVVAVVGIFGFGQVQKEKGARQERERRRLKDISTSNEVRKKIHVALDDDRDVPAVDRLRKSGRLRDGD